MQKWIRIRKELYRHVKEQVRHRSGRLSQDLSTYQQQYDREFKKRWKVSTRTELFHALEQAKVIFLSDFHALQQSQKAQLRILKHLKMKKTTHLMLECFEAQDQPVLDRFMDGKLSEKEFLKKIEWQKKWGFPWEYYRPILRYAQQKKMKVKGLNLALSSRTSRSLQRRDLFAAKLIAEEFFKNQDSQIFIIYGELHLAQAHLPGQFSKIAKLKANSEKVLTVFQNSENIYFQLLAKELESSVDIVRLSQNQFCMMSVPPWVKWQNYLMYLEKTYDSGLYDDEEGTDYTDHVGSYARLISEELGLKVSLSDLSVYSAGDSGFWRLIKDQFSAEEARIIEYLIEDEMSFYLPEIQAAYLARPTVNHAASLAMQFVYFDHTKVSRSCLRFPADFLARIWIEGMTYFGSKLINHKRKADTIADIKASLAARSSSELGQEEMMLALSQKMNELMVISGQSLQSRIYQPRKKRSYLSASALLGGMIGERLYHGYRRRLLSMASLRYLLKKDVGNKDFALTYYEMMEIIESLPAPFRSKKEKM